MAITISGQNNNDKILASDGVLDSISGFNVVGVMTAAQFDVTGKTTTNHLNIGSNIQIGNAGIITATTLIGNVTGNINASSTLLLQTGGSERFRIASAGQLGIGGANYGSVGQVLTSGGSGGAATWSTISSDKITEGNTEAEVYDNGSDGRFTVKTEGSERLRVSADGNVTVGAAVTISPVGNINATGIITATSFYGSGANLTGITQTTINNNAANKVIMGSNTANTLEAVAKSTLFGNLSHGQNFLDDQNLIFGDGSDMILIHTSSGAKSRLRNTNDSGSLDIESTLTRFLNKDGSSEKLRITSAGSLGIGTATPQVQTHIFGADAELLIERGGYSEAELWLGFPSGQPFIASGPGKGLKLGGNGKWNEGLLIGSDGKLTVAGTGAIKIPAGTTAQRPGSSVAGDIRYNSTASSLEFYTGSAWIGTNIAPSINSVTGDIYNGIAGKTLVINCNDISASNNSVKYSNNSNGSVIATDSSPSTSGSNITSTIPANVYNTAAGTVIKIEVINAAGVISSNSVTETILAAPSGGSITNAGGYTYHTFTSSGTFANTVANLSVQYLVVAGGGGGGGNQGGGAGGAGGYRTGSATLSTGNYSASIGGGGGNGGNGNSGYGSDGGNSSFNSLTSTGGGGGANMNTGAQTVNGRSGGSGGGASHWLNGNGSGGSGTSGQGNSGGGALDTESLGHNGGGGGGAGGSGSNGQGAYGGNGGNGTAWLNGTTYAGGGGGGCYYNNNSGGSSNYSIGGGAGTGGGGRGSRNTQSKLSTNYSAPTTNQNGVDGYGGGGGGGGNQPGNGGDGVVIIRYQL